MFPLDKAKENSRRSEKEHKADKRSRDDDRVRWVRFQAFLESTQVLKYELALGGQTESQVYLQVHISCQKNANLLTDKNK